MKRTMQLAHRYTYYIFTGPFDLSKCVLHHCDNPACVNPDHLLLGTYHDNSQDMVLRGRHHKKGSKTIWPKRNEIIMNDDEEIEFAWYGVDQIKTLDINKAVSAIEKKIMVRQQIAYRKARRQAHLYHFVGKVLEDYITIRLGIWLELLS